MKSWILWAEYTFIMCQSIGLPPISMSGFGFETVSSLIRLPIPPAKMTAFTCHPPKVAAEIESQICLFQSLSQKWGRVISRAFIMSSDFQVRREKSPSHESGCARRLMERHQGLSDSNGSLSVFMLAIRV